MMAERMDRRRLKRETRALLAEAQVPPVQMTALYLGLLTVLRLADEVAGGSGPLERNLPGIFAYVLVSLMTTVLAAGFVLYCMAVRRGQRAEYLTVFDGFSFAGKVIALDLLVSAVIVMWSLALLIPGVVALYRLRFARYNLYEDPDMGIFEAMRRSRLQTAGYKSQLLMLDASYLGWILLGMLPSLVNLGWVYWHFFRLLMASGGLADPAVILSQVPEFLPGVSNLVWLLICSVWQMGVSVFYMAQRQCVELAYYEAGKRTAGFGDPESPELPGGDGPDDLGGW